MNDDLVERLKEARWMLQSGGLSRASNSVLEAIAELTRLRKENERLYKLVLGRTDQAKKLRIENHDLRGEVASLRSGATAQTG